MSTPSKAAVGMVVARALATNREADVEAAIVAMRDTDRDTFRQTMAALRKTKPEMAAELDQFEYMLRGLRARQ